MNGSSALSPRPAIDHIRKPQILRAAAEVITERGLAATRIADVAERAGTSTSAVLYWFESREQLLSEALTADEVDFDAMLEARLENLDSARAKLAAVIDATVGAVDMSLWIELWSRSLHDPASRRERRRLDQGWRGRIASVVEEGQALGEFAAEVDAARFAISLAALMDGLSVQVTLADPDVLPATMLAICSEYAEQQLGIRLDARRGHSEDRHGLLVEGE